MDPKMLDVVGALIGKGVKLKDLKGKGLGPDIGPVANWAVAWSHYALAGDAKVGAPVDAAGVMNIGNHKIGPDDTIEQLLEAIKNKHHP